MDKNDPNTWTKLFISTNRGFCLDFLKSTNTQVMNCVRQGNYAAAVAGLDRIQNGLVAMNNARCGDYHSHLSMFSMCEGFIIAFGVFVPSPDESRRRKTALQLFEDARDFAKSTDTKKYLEAVIAELRSGKSLARIKEESGSDFPQAVINILTDMNSKLSSC